MTVRSPPLASRALAAATAQRSSSSAFCVSATAVSPVQDVLAQHDHEIVGEVIFRDAFGNLITNISAERLAPTPHEHWSVEVAGTRIEGIGVAYGERPTGTLMALMGSCGWLEIAVVNGDAARQLTAGPGTTVWMRKDARR